MGNGVSPVSTKSWALCLIRIVNGLFTIDAKEAYVVYALYSTGDTFGCSTGNLAILAIFGRRKHAEAIAELVEKTISGGKYIEAVEYNGLTVNISHLCGGYFNQCEQVTVQKFNVIDTLPRKIIRSLTSIYPMGIKGRRYLKEV